MRLMFYLAVDFAQAPGKHKIKRRLSNQEVLFASFSENICDPLKECFTSWGVDHFSTLVAKRPLRRFGSALGAFRQLCQEVLGGEGPEKMHLQNPHLGKRRGSLCLFNVSANI